MKKYALFLALGASLAFYSCKKDDTKVTPINNPSNPNNPANDTVPKITYLMAKAWRLTGLTQGAPGSPTQSDLYSSGYPNCQKDDLYKFTGSDALLVETGQAKCGTSDANKSGTWDLNNNSTLLNITIPTQSMVGMTGTFAVLELTATRMILRQTVSGSEYTLIYTAQ